MEPLLVLQQPEAAAVAAQLDRIATALTVMAVSGVVVGLFAVISLLVSLFAHRTANRVIGSLERHVDRLAPRVEPLLENLTRLANDSRDVTESVRRRVNELMDTVADLNRSLKHAGKAAEVRVRELAAVLDVVKEEAEEVLLDTAATARGLHAAAEALRAPAAAPPAMRPPRAEGDEEVAS